MAWTIEYTDTARNLLSKLDKQSARYCRLHGAKRGRTGRPRVMGKSLSGPLGGLWRYRVGDYRVICDI